MAGLRKNASRTKYKTVPVQLIIHALIFGQALKKTAY